LSEKTELKNLVPGFVVYLNGSRFTAEQEMSVKQIVVEDRVDSISTFTLTLSDASRQWTDSDDLAEGSKVKILVGYKDDVEEVGLGEVTGINPQFRMNSDDLVVVKGCNLVHRLLRGKKTRSFNEMTDVDIIKQIADEGSVKVDVSDIGIDHLFTMQHNQTNYDYLAAMVRKYDCKMYVKDEKLSIKKIGDESSDEVIVEWGKTLLEFNVQADTSTLLSEVEVRGWDNEKGEVITGTAKTSDLKKTFDKNTFGGDIVKKNFGDAKMIVVDNAITDQNSADALSLDIISNNSSSYVRGTGKAEGNNKIHAGMLIELKELGTRFSGKYFVESTRHVLDVSSGYNTYFTVSRNAT
jgi:phage protein D